MFIVIKGTLKNSIGHIETNYYFYTFFCSTLFINFLFLSSHTVLPENPIILDRWGRVINRTTIGPMEEGDDVILSCRVIGGKYWSITWCYLELFSNSMNFYRTHFELYNFITPLNQILPYRGWILFTHIVFAHLLIYAYFKFSLRISTFFHLMRVNLLCNKLFKLLFLDICLLIELNKIEMENKRRAS